MLHIGQIEFARMAGMSKTGFNHVENGNDPRASTLKAIQSAFEERGIRFVETDGEVGVMIGKGKP